MRCLGFDLNCPAHEQRGKDENSPAHSSSLVSVFSTLIQGEEGSQVLWDWLGGLGLIIVVRGVTTGTELRSK